MTLLLTFNNVKKLHNDIKDQKEMIDFLNLNEFLQIMLELLVSKGTCEIIKKENLPKMLRTESTNKNKFTSFTVKTNTRKKVINVRVWKLFVTDFSSDPFIKANYSIKKSESYNDPKFKYDRAYIINGSHEESICLNPDAVVPILTTYTIGFN